MDATVPHHIAGFTVTPMARPAPQGGFLASVSLRRGLYDRVYRLLPCFDSAAQAVQHAAEQGRRIALGGQPA